MVNVSCSYLRALSWRAGARREPGSAIWTAGVSELGTPDTDDVRHGAYAPKRHDVFVHDVTIRGDMIRLGQLLKLAGLADSGGEARVLLEEDLVYVNGELEARRGRQLRDGDVVVCGDETVRVVTA